MIVTAAARWMIVISVIAAGVGLMWQQAFMLTLAVATLLWIGFEWICFRLWLDVLINNAVARRDFLGPNGEARTLWQSRPVTVKTTVSFPLEATILGRLLAPIREWLPPIHAHAYDLLPTIVDLVDGESGSDCLLGSDSDVTVTYRLVPRLPGIVRHTGVRLIASDLHGFFHSERYLPLPSSVRALPLAIDAGTVSPLRKQNNALPPPGIHTIPRAGVGSELLEIRDYVSGDAPRSIAWKVSARRGELMTRQFESEVPVRCQLFLDMSSSVRLGYPGHCIGSRLLGLAATIASSLASHRDPVGLSIFDGRDVRIARPSASRKAVIQMVDMMSQSLDEPLPPVKIKPDSMIRSAFDIVRIRYPEALQQSEYAFTGWIPRSASWKRRQRLSALIANHYRLDPLAMGELMDDDDVMSTWLQRFHAEHGSPFTGSLFDERGNPLFDDSAKIDQLAKLLRRAAVRGRDNELFVVMAELTDAEYTLKTLVQEIRFARARYHRVVVLLAWPAKLPAPQQAISLDMILNAPTAKTGYLVERRQKEQAFLRVRNELGKLGVPVAVAAEEVATPLIMNQLQIVRTGRALAQ